MVAIALARVFITNLKLSENCSSLIEFAQRPVGIEVTIIRRAFRKSQTNSFKVVLCKNTDAELICQNQDEPVQTYGVRLLK